MVSWQSFSPHDELQIFPYNRLVRDLNGHTPVQFVDALAPHFKLQLTQEPGNPPPSGFDMYIGGQWHRATPIPMQDSPLATSCNPVQSLAVSVLTQRVLQPLLGIMDQRSDPRINFVGGDAWHRTPRRHGQPARVVSSVLVVSNDR